ncbi:MAG: hypothetical protein ACP5KN_01805 [Armatimonadota bacterium]
MDDQHRHSRAPEDDPPAEECRALARIYRPSRWPQPGAKIVAAMCYFSWLGYVTAFVPLLLVRIRRLRRWRSFAFHAYASVGWSLVVAGLRLALMAGSLWAGACRGPTAESVCNALNMLNLVVVLAFSLLLSCVYAAEALLGRDVSIPGITPWARRHAALWEDTRPL